jgi:LmbE family N-acetylglucosaminyl deacetylase
VASCNGLQKETIVSARRLEAETACRHLGVQPDELRWLSLPDGDVPRTGDADFEKALHLLLTEINAFSPGEVFCPHPLDFHQDHAAAAELISAAARRASKPFAVIHYPVWMWYHASLGLGRRLKADRAWRLDGGSVRSKKRAAMGAYLEAQKALNGSPYCGKLPWAFLWNFRRRSELFFSESSRD